MKLLGRMMTFVAAASITACDSKKLIGVDPIACPAVGLAVTVTPPSATIGVGDTMRLAANFQVGLCGDPTNHGPGNWSTSNSAIAAIDSGGLVTAHGSGTATITSTSTVDANVKGSAFVIVR